MSGAELTAVWLFGLLCGSIVACTVAKLVVVGRVMAATLQAQVDAAQVAAEVQASAAVFPPASWSARDGES